MGVSYMHAWGEREVHVTAGVLCRRRHSSCPRGPKRSARGARRACGVGLASGGEMRIAMASSRAVAMPTRVRFPDSRPKVAKHAYCVNIYYFANLNNKIFSIALRSLASTHDTCVDMIRSSVAIISYHDTTETPRSAHDLPRGTHTGTTVHGVAPPPGAGAGFRRRRVT